MNAARRPHYAIDEYIRLEAMSVTKHEFFDGVIYATSGGTPHHAALAARVIATLGSQLVGRPCATFTSDLRIRVPAGERAELTSIGCTLDVDAIYRDPLA